MAEDVSRRDILKLAGMATAGLALAGSPQGYNLMEDPQAPYIGAYLEISPHNHPKQGLIQKSG